MKDIFAFIGFVATLIVFFGGFFLYFIYKWDNETKSKMTDADKRGFGRPE